jgi:hypothetical protein
MTRKDYILIAEALTGTLDSYTDMERETGAILHAAEAIAVSLAADNPHFNRTHFLAVVRGEKELTSRPARS